MRIKCARGRLVIQTPRDVRLTALIYLFITWASLTPVPALCICGVSSTSNRLLAMPINNHVSSRVSRVTSIWLTYSAEFKKSIELSLLRHSCRLAQSSQSSAQVFWICGRRTFDNEFMIACARLLWVSSTLLTSLRLCVKIAAHQPVLPRMNYNTLLTKWFWSAADSRSTWSSIGHVIGRC